ncbi:hypothetical protein [Pantoea sp. OXWO6B1]|uniref:hypothetical protein n=1 Tax=Pantoea sp. OXWO6B1 TaxID=1835724 RepID=UPI0007C6D3AE|nr:hypothetical protein [Pantoea sp. OXWO6B1]OAD97982.1 hypothetical protein A6A26_23790 [Pantoea sp. OXWO6B1]
MRAPSGLKVLLTRNPLKESTIIITGNIKKATITQLRSKAIVNGILAAIYTGPTKDDSTTAAADFVNHPTLYNEGSVRTACGNNFNKIQSAFVGQALGIAEMLADAAIDADKT